MHLTVVKWLGSVMRLAVVASVWIGHSLFPAHFLFSFPVCLPGVSSFSSARSLCDFVSLYLLLIEAIITNLALSSVLET